MKTITIATVDGKKYIEACYMRGVWAAHRVYTWAGPWKRRDGWAVTHLPTGLRLNCFRTAGLAQDVVDHLCEGGAEQWRKRAKWASKRFTGSMPAVVQRWAPKAVAL